MSASPARPPITRRGKRHWAQYIANAFGLDDANWYRHANPVSGWSRAATGLPLIVLSIWSRVWIGWLSLLPLAGTMLWLWLNPRLFAAPRDDRAWMTRGVLGERLWTRGVSFPTPARDRWLIGTANTLTALCAIAMAYGLWRLDEAMTLIGAAGAFTAKLWFIGRMAKIYERAVAYDPSYAYGASA